MQSSHSQQCSKDRIGLAFYWLIQSSSRWTFAQCDNWYWKRV